MIIPENLRNAVRETLEEIPRIREEVGDNWFPCGFAHLHISGNSEFVRWMKKHGSKRNGYYSWNKIEIGKGHPNGYNIYLRYPATTATEQQSLNFKEPLYSEFQKQLESLGIETTLRTRWD